MMIKEGNPGGRFSNQDLVYLEKERKGKGVPEAGEGARKKEGSLGITHSGCRKDLLRAPKKSPILEGGSIAVCWVGAPSSGRTGKSRRKRGKRPAF